MTSIGTLPGERLAGLSADLFHKVQNGSITLDELALFTQRKNPFAELLDTASPTAIVAANPDLLSVDCGKSLADMITAGHYDWVNNDITASRFPIKGKGVEEVETKEFWFDTDIESDDAKTRIEQDDTANPWMSARVEHLLAYGAKFPEKQRQYPIVGLGSVCKVSGRRCVPYLHGGVAHRHLCLDRWDVGWNRRCRFLAVRKKVSAPQT